MRGGWVRVVLGAKCLQVLSMRGLPLAALVLFMRAAITSNLFRNRPINHRSMLLYEYSLLATAPVKRARFHTAILPVPPAKHTRVVRARDVELRRLDVGAAAGAAVGL